LHAAARTEPQTSKTQTFSRRGFPQRLFTSAERQVKLAAGTLEIKVKVSYLEIYNETLMDLVAGTQNGLKLSESRKTGTGIVCENLTETDVADADQAHRIFIDGTKNRRRAATAMNKESSRSHTIFTLVVESAQTASDGITTNKFARLHMVDLAGSERQRDTKAEGERLKEASSINISLLTLGRVMNNLAVNAKGGHRHVNFRDSKLTHFLKESLGGNAKTLFVANIGPGEKHFGETLSTLKFANQCKQIKNKPKVNEDASGSIADLQAEIRRLKEAVKAAEGREHATRRQSINGRRLSSMAMQSLSPMRGGGGAGADVAIVQETLNRVTEHEALLLLSIEKMEEQADEIQNSQKALKNREKRLQETSMVIKMRDSHIKKLKAAAKKDGETTYEDLHVHELELLRQEIKELTTQLENGTDLAHAKAEVVRLTQLLAQLEKERKQDTVTLTKGLHKQTKNLIEEKHALMQRVAEMTAAMESLSPSKRPQHPAPMEMPLLTGEIPAEQRGMNRPLASIAAMAKAAMEPTLAAKEAQAQAAEEKLAASLAEQEQASQALAQSQAESHSVKERASVAEEKVSEQALRVMELDREVEEHKEAMEQLLQRVVASQERETELEEQVSTLKGDLTQSRTEAATKREEADAMAGTMEQLHETSDSLQAELHLQIMKSDELTRQKAQVEGDVNRIRAQLNDATDVISTLSGDSKDLGTAQEAKVELQQKNGELSRQLATMESELQAAQAGETESKAAIKQVLQSRDDLQEECQRLQAVTEANTGELTASKLELTKLTEELEAERVELSSSRSQRAEIEDRLHAAEEDHANRRAALEYQISELIKEQAQTAKDLADLSVDHARAGACLTELTQERERLQVALQQSDELMALQKSNHAALATATEDTTRREREEATRKLNESQLEVENALAEKQSLEKSLENAKSRSDVLREKLDKIQEENSRVEVMAERDAALESAKNNGSPAMSFQSCEVKDSLSPPLMSPSGKITELTQNVEAENAVAKSTELEEENTLLEAELEKQADLNKRATEALTRANTEKKKLSFSLGEEKRRAETLAVESTELQAQLTVAQSQLSGLQEETNKARQAHVLEISSLEKALAEATTAATQAKAVIGEASRETIERFQGENLELKARLEEKEYMVGVDQAQLEAQMEDYTRLAMDRDECLQKLMVARADADSFYEQTTLKQGDIEQLREQLAGRKSELTEAQAEVSKLMKLSNPNAKIQHVNKMKEDYNTCMKERDQHKAQLEKKKRVVAALEKEAAKKGGGKLDLKALEEMDGDMEKLKAKLETEKQGREQAETDLESIAAALGGEARAAEGKPAVKEVLHLVATLQKKNEESERLIRKSNDEIFVLTRKTASQDRRVSHPIAAVPSNLSEAA